jgi:hypothetical protein
VPKFEIISKVPEEPDGILAKEAAGHHPWQGNHTKYQPEELYIQ